MFYIFSKKTGIYKLPGLKYILHLIFLFDKQIDTGHRYIYCFII